MMQAALDDEDILAAIGEGKFPAIGDRAFRRAFELREQTGREVHAFEPGETETLERDQTISATTKKLDNFGVARPLRSAQSSEARDKLSNFLFRRFESQGRGFPGIRGKRILHLRICFGFRRFLWGWRHLRWAEERTFEGSHRLPVNSRQGSRRWLRRGPGCCQE